MGGLPPHRTKRVGISGNDGRGGVSQKYREVSERQKKGNIITGTKQEGVNQQSKSEMSEQSGLE
jgi:hypothetical protein